MPRVCFLDNDVILKLTACNLFWEAIASLKADQTKISVLNSARYVFDGAAARQRYSDAICNQAIANIQKCIPIRAQAGNPYLALKLQDVDVGELILTFEVAMSSDCLLVTGDKKFLRALSRHEELAPLYQGILGRVICLEQIIAYLIEAEGFEVVRARVTEAREYDTALKAAFGSGLAAEILQVSTTLSKYIQELQADCPNLLASG